MSSRAYSYVRFSSAEQEKGDSLRRQTERSKEYCEQHNLILDTTLTADKGISAFKGKNRSVGSLGKFFNLIAAGIVKQGDTLIVENLDRLSRKSPMQAMTQFAEIIEAGVRLVTLMDGQTYTQESIEKNPSQLFVSLGIMMRANEESKTKADRGQKAWDNKRAKASTNNEPITSRCPGWLRLVDGKFKFHEKNLATLRRILKFAGDGIGCDKIMRILNKEKVPTFKNNGKVWSTGTIKYLMTTKSVMGEFQPKSTQIKAIDPIPNYFPPAITEAEFYRIQHVVGQRRRNSVGRTGEDVVNLFGKLLVCGRDGSTMVVLQPTTKEKRNLVSSLANNGAGKEVAFGYHAFENHMLRRISEITINPVDNTSEIDLQELQGRAADVAEKIEKVNVQLTSLKASDTTFDRMLNLLSTLDKQENEIKKQIETAKATTQSHAIQKPDEFTRLFEYDSLQKKSGDELAMIRTRIRTYIQNVVKQIKVFIHVKGWTRVCHAHIHFNNGSSKWLLIRTRRKEDSQSITDDKPIENLPEAVLNKWLAESPKLSFEDWNWDATPDIWYWCHLNANKPYYTKIGG